MPLMPVTVRLAGAVSSTETSPLVSEPPMFDAVRVYEPVPPWTNVPLCDFATTRSGSGGGGANVAVTSRAWLIVTWHDGDEPEQSPVQPENCWPLRPAAVRVTIVPAS